MIRKLLLLVQTLFLNSISEKVLTSKLKLLFLGMFLIASLGYGQNRTWTGATNSNWNTNSNWSPANVPNNGNDVFIPSGTPNSPVIDANSSAKSLNISGTLTIGDSNTNRTITVSGSVTINSGGQFTTAGNGGNTLSLTGDLVNNGTFNMNNGNATALTNFNGTGTQTISGTGTTTDFFDLTLTNNTSFVINRTIRVAEDWANNGKTVSGSGTVTFISNAIPTGTTIGGSTVTSFPNLIMTNNSTTTQSRGAIITGNFIIDGGSTLTTNNNALTFGGNFTNNGALNAGSSLITITGTSTQNIAGFTTTGNVTMTKTGGVATFTGSVSGAVLTINGSGGTLNLGTRLSHTFSSVTLTNGTLNGGSSIISLSASPPFTVTGGNFDPGTGTVNLNRAAAQSTILSNFYNLTLAGGDKTFTGTVIITNILSIATGAKAALGTNAGHKAGALVLGTSTRTSGTYGGTATAGNVVTGSFTPTSGIVTITNDSCLSFAAIAPITKVTLNSLSSSTSETSTVAYENIPAGTATTTLNKGDYYSLVVKGNTSGDVNMYYTAFFDWNGNGSFDTGEGPVQIGTIRNSSGLDEKATSVYFQVPPGATGTSIKMRIIGLLGAPNSTSCTVNTGTGQVEDYTITLQAGCTGTLPATVSTSSTASTVCPDVPFTLSLGNTFGDGATYAWETSSSLTGPWASAATPAVAFFNSTFSTNQAHGTTVGDMVLNGGDDTEIKDGVLVLTDIALDGHNGGFLINKANTANITPFTVTYKYRIQDGGNVGADGMSLSYGPGFTGDAGGGESGEGSGLRVQFDTYDNEGVAEGSRVRILYNNTSIFNTAIDVPFNLRTAIYRDVNLYVDTDGYLTLGVQNASGTLVTVVSKLLLPGYATADKSTWKFKFSARTGGSKDKHSIDDLTITFLDSANSKAKFTTSQTAKTYYRAKVTCSTSSVTSTPVFVDMTSAVITTQPTAPLAVCSGAGVRTITVAATGSGLTYSWRLAGTPVVNGGVISGQGTNTLTLTNPLAANAGNYDVVINGACSSTVTSNVVAVVVNALPTPTFTAEPTGSTCIGTSVTYTTQGSMSNYVWGFTGVAGIDYTIVSGGTATDNSVTLIYKTIGNKTVNINYKNVPNGCTAVSSVTSGVVKVNPLPTPTFAAEPTGSTCIGTSVTYTTQGSMSNYVWGFTGVAGIDYTIVSGGTATDNSVTLIYKTIGDKTVTINYKDVPNGCTAASVVTSGVVKVNALPTPTFTAEPTGSTCIGTSVTYSTQGSMSNYVWGFTGVAGTDYAIVSGGTATDNSVTLFYKTIGDKTVTINYKDVPNGCTAASAVTSGVVKVNALPTPTFTAEPTGSTCIGTSVTYSTQGSMSNYVWGFTGVAGTDYAIVSGGTAADNSVTLFYKTIGNKTITINYKDVPNGCTAASAVTSGAVTVNALPVITTQPQPLALCEGQGGSFTVVTSASSPTYQWQYSTNISGPWTVTNGAAGVSGHTTATLSLTNVPVNYSGNFVRCIVTSNTCNTISDAVLLTVNALPTITVGTPTDVTCTTLGSVTLTNLPAGSWTLNQTGFASNTINNSGTSYTVTGLAVGTYRFTVNNGTCTSVVSSDAVITDQSSTTWDGTGWSKGTPDATKAAIINGAFTVSADLTACSLTINPGIAITVPSNRTLNIVNGLTVQPTASLTFDNHSSLVQVNNNGINTGKITYNRIAAQVRRGDFTYWSTPVSPQKLIDVSPLTLSDKYLGFNGDNWVVTNRNNNMVVGKGYIIRGPQTYSTTVKTDYPASFVGVPNNGIITGETMTAGKYYLIGNPYPSALNAKKFLDDNLFLDGTLYFWTHNTPVVLVGAYQYSSTDYASYNLTGGVGTAALSGSTPGNNNTQPSGNVGAGQSFFISATTAGTVTFNNGMRLGAANNGQFFKSADTDEKHRVWLNMTNAGGAFKQMLVGYVDGATNDYEKRYDGVSFDANPYLDFYSVANGNNYVIQGRALPFDDTDQVPLGYRTTIPGDFTISIDQVDGDFLTNINIYIQDKKTNVIHDLRAADYTFTTDKGTFSDRFVLRYSSKTLGTGDFENTENGLLVSVKEKTIKVTSSKENIKEVTIFDVTGKLLYNKKKVGTTELQIQNLQSANQVLLVKVTLENDFTATKKIIFN